GAKTNLFTQRWEKRGSTDLQVVGAGKQSGNGIEAAIVCKGFRTSHCRTEKFNSSAHLRYSTGIADISRDGARCDGRPRRKRQSHDRHENPELSEHVSPNKNCESAYQFTPRRTILSGPGSAWTRYR